MTVKELKEKIEKLDCGQMLEKAAAKLRGFPVNYYLGAAGVLILLALLLLGRNAGKSRRMKEIQTELAAVQVQVCPCSR